MAEIGQRERLADATLAVDRDDLRLALGFIRDDVGQVFTRLLTQSLIEVLQVRDLARACVLLHFVLHAASFQSMIILRQAGSQNAVS